MSSGFDVLSSDAREHVVVVGVNIEVPPAGMFMPPVGKPPVGTDPLVGICVPPLVGIDGMAVPPVGADGVGVPPVDGMLGICVPLPP